MHQLLENDFDLSGFDTRYRNDATSASAYPPGMLLKVILCAYAKGVVGSRGIERLCRDHVTFIALCGDSAPPLHHAGRSRLRARQRRRSPVCPGSLAA